MLKRAHRADGQALLLVALALGVLIALVVGVNAVVARRRVQANVQRSLDQAAASAVAELSTASLAGGAPALLPSAVETRFRAQLQLNLRRVATAVRPDPATLARQAHIVLLTAGTTCHGQPVSAPSVCAELTVTIPGVLDTPTLTLTTLAQASSRPGALAAPGLES